MNRHDWSRLNHLQLGRYSEYLVKMELTLYGLDIYGSEVDDKGIDFVARTDRGRYYDFQVKSIRGFNYIFFSKERFEPRDNLVAAVVVFLPEEAPHLFLMPSIYWNVPNSLFASRNYEGKKSKPEWGLNISKRNWDALQAYRFDKMVAMITGA
jgi:hypothetical protein